MITLASEMYAFLITFLGCMMMTKAEALEHVAAGGCVRRAIPEWDGGASLLRQGGDVVMTDGAAPAIPYENMDPDDSADWVAIECR